LRDPAALGPSCTVSLWGPRGVTPSLLRRRWWRWWALLLAWLSLGCSISITQVPAPRGALWGPEPPTHTRPRRQPAQGAWGPWGPWSACSSSCGDGVAFRTRRCLR
ncbi:UNVERIFIED_CONTAM: hypothetical protein H355_012504, partial [Colinus virginianus]